MGKSQSLLKWIVTILGLFLIALLKVCFSCLSDLSRIDQEFSRKQLLTVSGLVSSSTSEVEAFSMNTLGE
jgi:hypothetical protein